MNTVSDYPKRKNKPKRISHLKYNRLLKQIACLDHSVSVPSLGTLFRYDPNSPLGQAQAGIAEFFDVRFAYPSTNGTTPLNVIALLSMAYPGDSILIQRDSHVSVLAPMIHAGLHPVYLIPQYSQKLGIPMGITPEELSQSLDHHPEIRVIFLTYPNYFGIATDIKGLSCVASEYNIPLIVDSAHGSHWVFHPDFPLRADQTGAQIVTYSIHKTCPVLGQGSLALINDETIIPRLYEVVNNLGFVSTSFSYVILTALFSGMFSLSENGEEKFSEHLEMAEWARQEINKIDGLHSFGLEEVQPGFIDFDPLRLMVDVSDIGLTGYEIENLLIERYGVYPEMGTLQNVLFLITLGIGWEEIKRIVEILRQIANETRQPRHLPKLPQPCLPPQSFLPKEAFYHRKRQTIQVNSAVGMISAETISAYPPGSAVIVAGEEITQEVVDYLKTVQSFGGVLKGASDANFNFIQVLEI